MQIREFSAPITSKKLNESLAKKFGYKVNLENFTDVQLEDARNKLRTKISQFEMNESYDTMIESHEYQKTRMFLDVVNQAILEREEKADKDYDEDGKVETGPEEHAGAVDKAIKKAKAEKGEKVDENWANNQFRQRARQHSVPMSWIEGAIQRVELGESDRAELKAELKLRYDLSESTASWMLLEGEESKAEIIMATKDMVDRITGWLEDVAAMKAEQLLELTDSIRETSGSDVAQAYTEAVKPALEAIYTALETSRQGLTSGLAVVSGGEAPTMGAPIGGMEAGAADLGNELAGAEPPMPGGEEVAPEELPAPGGEAERMKRESVEYSRRLGMMLTSKKK